MSPESSQARGSHLALSVGRVLLLGELSIKIQYAALDKWLNKAEGPCNHSVYHKYCYEKPGHEDSNLELLPIVLVWVKPTLSLLLWADGHTLLSIHVWTLGWELSIKTQTAQRLTLVKFWARFRSTFVIPPLRRWRQEAKSQWHCCSEASLG